MRERGIVNHIRTVMLAPTQLGKGLFYQVGGREVDNYALCKGQKAQWAYGPTTLCTWFFEEHNIRFLKISKNIISTIPKIHTKCTKSTLYMFGSTETAFHVYVSAFSFFFFFVGTRFRSKTLLFITVMNSSHNFWPRTVYLCTVYSPRNFTFQQLFH